MEKTILLTIKGCQTEPTGEENTIELITRGKLYKIDDSDMYKIEYEESEISGLEGSKTMIFVQGDQILMERDGTYPSKIVFEKGKKFINSYHTPFGVLQMEVYSTRVDHDIKEDEGKLDLKYQLGIGGRYTGTNTLSLKYNRI